LDAIKLLSEDNLTVGDAICVIDRETGGRAALEAVGVTLHALYTMADIENAHAA